MERVREIEREEIKLFFLNYLTLGTPNKGRVCLLGSNHDEQTFINSVKKILSKKKKL